MNGSHEHSFIFNTDGFEVCTKCGLCTSQREMMFRENNEMSATQTKRVEFSYILENNNIGYGDEIVKEYEQIKVKLKRGYPNLAVFAYSTYKILQRNNVFYTISQISRMFQLSNFQKYFTLIEKNPKIDTCLEIYTEQKYESSIRIFLSHCKLRRCYRNALQISKYLNRTNSNMKPIFHIASTLYLAINTCYKNKNEVLTLICDYFLINQRTLKKKVHDISVKHPIKGMIK